MFKPLIFIYSILDELGEEDSLMVMPSSEENTTSYAHKSDSDSLQPTTNITITIPESCYRPCLLQSSKKHFCNNLEVMVQICIDE